MRQRRPHKKAAKPRTKPSELTKVLTDKLAKIDRSVQDLTLRQSHAINQGTWVMNSMLHQLTTLQASVNQGGAAVVQMQGQLRTIDGQLHTRSSTGCWTKPSYGQAEEDETKRRQSSTRTSPRCGCRRCSPFLASSRTCRTWRQET